MLTPTQRYDLVTRAHAQLETLGLLLVSMSRGADWLADRAGICKAYNELANTVRELCREVDWPGPRPPEDRATNE